ncbi:MAG: hypothetical protein PHD79_09170, partial [Aliarcobacter sp.]|nr:hypothetical protein [Aliarcobacter sp.]
MNSFRVMNTRFRILKGGKIGLAFSIALIGGTLTLGSTKANATDYFTGTSTVLSPLTSGSVTVETATNTATNGNNTDTRNAATVDNVIFAPTSWANSFYIPTSTSTDYYGPLQDAYILNQNPDYLKLELTFASGANANNITKQGSTLYSAPVSPTYVPVSSTSTYSLTSTPTSIDYAANLIFQGNNTVSGYTAISDGNIKLNGDNIVFNGTVNAGSIDVAAVGTTTFKSAVNVSTGPVDDLKFSAAGTVVLNSDLTGNVVTTGNNKGILTTTGVNQTITGNIGSSTSLDLNTLNIGSDTVLGNYSKTTINGNVFANSTVLNNNNNDNSDGTTNSSELILASGKNITSTITTADANMGILTLAGGIQTVTGQVGNGNKLAEVNAGNGTSTFTNDVYATNLDVEGTGTVNLNGNYTGTALRYNDNGIVNLADGKNINSSVTTDAPNQGTLNLTGTSTVSGQVGDATNNLKEINANGTAGKTVTFANDVYATNTNIGAGTVDIKGNLTGAVNSTSAGVGTLTTTGII